MSRILVAATFAAILSTPVIASAAPGAQQQLMGTCNAQAKTGALTGDARKSFMASCFKGDVATTPQARMKSCNATAGKQALKGDARKSFMSSCLKG